MTLTQILQKIKSAFYTKAETESKLSAKANSSDLNNYLPRSGGAMTGHAITRDKDNETLQFHAGKAWTHGAWLHLAGKDYEHYDGFGAFTLGASNGTQSSYLTGCPDGSLTWNSKAIATSDDLANKADKTERFTCPGGWWSFAGYNRGDDGSKGGYDDITENGCGDTIDGWKSQPITGDGWGQLTSFVSVHDSLNNATQFWWGFNDRTRLFYRNHYGVAGWTGWGEFSVIVEQSTNFIRYANGLQICWGTVGDEATVTRAYSKPFVTNSYVSIVGSYIGEGASKILHFSNTNGVSFYCEKTPNVWADWHAIGRWK